MKLLQQISEKADKVKKLFTVTVLDDSGAEVEKQAKAFKLGDIKAYFGDKFVNAELHDDEVKLPSAGGLDADSDTEALDDEAAEDLDDADDAADDADADADGGKKKKKSKEEDEDEFPVDESFQRLSEMAKRTAPAEFWKMMVAEYGVQGAQSVTWAQIKAVADKNDVLIPAYIRDNKIGRGKWTAKPADMKAPAHEPVAKKTEPAPVKKAEEPKAAAKPAEAPAAAPKRKEMYHKADFPDVEFVWTTTYHDGRDLMAAIEKHHGVSPSDTESVNVDGYNNYYILKKGTMEVLGRKSIKDMGVRPGFGRVVHLEGNIAMSKKAVKQRDENLYGFLIKPQHGSPYISVGTQHSYGPWDKFSAEANVSDKYEHFAYNDDFGHGTIQVVKVKKVNGEWVRA